MRSAWVYMHSERAGVLDELIQGKQYRFTYLDDYKGEPISRAMPLSDSPYEFDRFPPFFDGLLPEGVMLEGLLRQKKIDRYDMFSQLLVVGHEMVGAVTVEAAS